MIRRPASRPPRRPGFTLIELLVVVTIIGILVALLLPAIVGAIRRANEARVSADIQTLAVALQSFRNTYGEYPPSRVVLSESGVYSVAFGSLAPQGAIISPQAGDYSTALASVTWIVPTSPGYQYPGPGNADISFGTLAERSVRALRKYFPRALPPTPTNASPQTWHDFNGNGTLDPGFIYLQGDECLAFFLGGIPNPSGGGSFGMTGFGRNPLYPFVGAAGTSNRTQSLFEFRAERLVDDDGDGIPSYYDPNGGSGATAYAPYAYFSSYGAAGYDPNDCNFFDPNRDPSINPLAAPYQLGTPVIGNAGYTTSFGPNPYTSSFPLLINSANLPQPTSYLNANSFQIISSGGDLSFGSGGQFLNNAVERLTPTVANNYYNTDDRAYEHDNITNFTQGRLE